MTDDLTRAREMHAEALTSLAKVRDAERFYQAARRDYEARLRAKYRVPDDRPLPDKLVETARQNTDRDTRIVDTMKKADYHIQRAIAFNLGYLVEVDRSWRFADGPDHRDSV